MPSKPKPVVTKNPSAKKVIAKRGKVVKKVNSRRNSVAKKAAVKKVTSAKKPNLKIAPKKKVAIKKVLKKSSSSKKIKAIKKDYFKLPFEVYYSEYVPITENEFKSDVEVKRFKDIKAVIQRQGGCWGLSLECRTNNGPELYCCITNSHDEVDPNWLSTIDEEDINFNYAEDFSVQIDDGKIKFVDLSDEQRDEDSENYLDVDNMDYCYDGFLVYHLSDSSPDFLILDAKDTRVKVNLDGYVLDDDGNKTKNRIFNPDNLDAEKFENVEGRDLWDARDDWIDGILKENFPKDKNLKYSPY